MNEGYIFLCLTWLSCWYWTFLSRADIRTRRKWLLIIFSTIFISDFSIRLHDIPICLTWVFLLIASLYHWSKYKNSKLILNGVVTCIMAIAIATVQLYSILEPLWVIVDTKIVLSILIFFLAEIFSESIWDGIVTAVIGIGFGELVYSFCLQSIGGLPVGINGGSLDLMAINCLLNIVWANFSRLFLYKRKTTVFPRSRGIK